MIWMEGFFNVRERLNIPWLGVGTVVIVTLRIQQVDPQVAVVPDVLINFIAKQSAHQGVLKFRDQCRMIPGSIWEERQQVCAVYASSFNSCRGAD